jgi:hypothetical protein
MAITLVDTGPIFRPKEPRPFISTQELALACTVDPNI